MKIAKSILAEIYIGDLKLNQVIQEYFYNWLNANCTFKHVDSFEFLIHLYQDESEEWFIKNQLDSTLPKNINDLIVKARKLGAARLCFYE